ATGRDRRSPDSPRRPAGRRGWLGQETGHNGVPAGARANSTSAVARPQTPIRETPVSSPRRRHNRRTGQGLRPPPTYRSFPGNSGKLTEALLLAEQQVDHPAPADVPIRGAAVGEDALVVTAGVEQRVVQDRQAVVGLLLVDALGDALD